MFCKFSNLAFSSVSWKTLDQVTTFEMQGGEKTLPSPHSADWAICSRSFQTMSAQSHHAAKDTDGFHAWLDSPYLLLSPSSSPCLLQVLLPFLMSFPTMASMMLVLQNQWCRFHLNVWWDNTGCFFFTCTNHNKLIPRFETNVVGIIIYFFNSSRTAQSSFIHFDLISNI